jgi:hypothetical protein
MECWLGRSYFIRQFKRFATPLADFRMELSRSCGMNERALQERRSNVIQMRMIFGFLIAVLAWDALDWGIEPAPLFVSASYILLGFVCAAAFPSRPWLGMLIGVTAAVAFEMLQSIVPERSVHLLDMVAKWLCVFAGIGCELAVAFAWRRSSERTREQ